MSFIEIILQTINVFSHMFRRNHSPSDRCDPQWVQGRGQGPLHSGDRDPEADAGGAWGLERQDG